MNKLFDKYLNKQALYPNLIKAHPSNNLKLIVIIPAYNEPEIFNTLNSLKNCKPSEFPSEVIIVFNHAENATNDIITQNKRSFANVFKWSKLNSSEKLTFYPALVENLPKKHAGAGLARKIAMDEAIRRFNTIDQGNGIIASLDADTLVSENYLKEIQTSFISNKKLNTAIFSFEHIQNENIKYNNAIETYELHLRYFKQALDYTGFPYAYHTIGSCFAVKASTYVKQGGMNRRQAGEDFYFLHKVFPLGHCKELNHVKVFPSSRPSDRVPFGTGPAIQKIINEGDYLTYQPKYFQYLKVFFESKPELFKANSDTIQSFYETLNFSLKSFMTEQEFLERINEINSNCATPKSFEKRFFQWFDAFKIIKYLNFIHEKEERISTNEAASIFFNNYIKANNQNFETNSSLELFRKLEK